MSAPVVTPLDLVARHEGFRAKPYCDRCGGVITAGGKSFFCRCLTLNQCPGAMTIGYGLNLDAGGLREDEARLILRNRLTTIAADHRILEITSPLNYARKAAIIDLAFNLGINGLLEFRGMLEALAAGDFYNAVVRLNSSLAARQEPTRIRELALMILNDAWPVGDYS